MFEQSEFWDFSESSAEKGFIPDTGIEVLFSEKNLTGQY